MSAPAYAAAPAPRFPVCCDRCWHAADKPCADYPDCFAEGPRCHADEACAARCRGRARGLRREELERPVVFVGTGTCGLGAGADKTLAAVKAWLAKTGTAADVVEVGCIGLCTAEPLVDVQLPGRTRVSWSRVEAAKVPTLLAEALAGRPPMDGVVAQFRAEGARPFEGIPFLDQHPFFAPQTRRILERCGHVDPGSLDEYLARGGYRALAAALREGSPAKVRDTVEKSGLRGRGGGGFSTGQKWQLAAAEKAEHRCLVCNADEGDPGAFMNRAEIEGDPYRLLEGMTLAAYAIGADEAFIYIRAEYPLAVRRLLAALEDVKARGLLGERILGSDFSLKIKLKQGAGAFVCGEETALMHSIEGRRGMPRPRPPYPSTRGLFGRPTVINNVETFYNVPDIVRRGADWYRGAGSGRSVGTKVFALSGKVERTGLVEVAFGTTVRKVVFDIGGGIPGGKAFKAVQIGGPSGGCLSEAQLDTVIDYESVKQAGAMIGSGGLVVMDESTCMIDLARYFMDFIQRESCGKCIPCREGTRRMLETLERVTKRPKNDDGVETLRRFEGVTTIEKLADVLRDTSLCGLGQSAPNPVLSTLRNFREEYDEHLFDRHCRAGACKGLLVYEIDPDACHGCGVCTRTCPADAIVGTLKQPHVILKDKCTACGTCLDVCRLGAVRAA